MPNGQENDPDVTAGERRRAEEAERRCARYRDAFALMLHEPFNDLDSTLERMLLVLCTTLDIDRASFWTFEDAAQSIRRTHQHDRKSTVPESPALLHKRDYPEYFDALAEQLVVAAHDARVDPRTRGLDSAYLQPLGITSMLDVPVVAFGRYLGVLCHEHIGPKREWLAEEQHFASCVATQVALAHERDHALRAQRALLKRSLHDDESQLPNRVHLDHRMEECVGRDSKGVAMVVASVDQYNFLVGSLGAARVQQWTRQFALQLLAAGPADSFAARIAPNEFALLLPDIERDAVPGAVEAWTARLAEPLELDGQKLFLTLSAGYSYRESSTAADAESLRSEARLAAGDAHGEGGARVRPFVTAMRDRLVARAGIEQDLRRGLDAMEFSLHYQPIVHLESARCVAVEALLRWKHPRHGMVRPAEFMQIAIDSGIMLTLGRSVIRAACQGLVRLRRGTGIADLTVSINMSAPEILLPGTLEVVQAELETAALPPTALAIEITESVFILDLQRARQALEELRACGVRVSLDDFGTAYSSLSWLRELPIDCVKIDRAFVAGVSSDSRDLAIVKSIAGLATAFGQKVIAEGIETPEQLRILRAAGIEYGQGYLFAAPAPVEMMDAAWMRRTAAVNG